MKNIAVALSDAQYRVARAISAMPAYEFQAMGIPPSKEPQALIGIIERPRRNQNATHRFRGVNKCEPPQPPQSQEVNQPAAESHSIAANVQL
jgi:hypothetical protein